MGTRSIYVSLLRGEEALILRYQGFIVDNIVVCEMNRMGARKTFENHEDYLKYVLAMNENVEIEICVVLIASWRGWM